MQSVFWSSLKVAVSKAPINKSRYTLKCPKPKWPVVWTNQTHPELMALSSRRQLRPQEIIRTLTRRWMPPRICSMDLVLTKVNFFHRTSTQATLVLLQLCSINTKFPNLITCQTCTQTFKSLNLSLKTLKINTNYSSNINSTSNLSGKWCRWCKCRVRVMTNSPFNHSRKFLITQRVANMLPFLMAQATLTAVHAHSTRWALAAWFPSCLAHLLLAVANNSRQLSSILSSIRFSTRLRFWVSSHYQTSSLGSTKTRTTKTIISQKLWVTRARLASAISIETSHNSCTLPLKFKDWFHSPKRSQTSRTRHTNWPKIQGATRTQATLSSSHQTQMRPQPRTASR